MIGSLFALSLALEPDRTEFARVVRLVRENYSGYSAAKASYERPHWDRLEKTAEESGTIEALKMYLARFEDPRLVYKIPDPPRERPTIRLNGGRRYLQLTVSSEPREKRFDPSWIVPTFYATNATELEHVATGRSPRYAVLDLRQRWSGQVPPDSVLAFLTDRKTLAEPGLEILVTKENLVAWRSDPRGLPGGPETLARMAKAPHGTFLSLTKDRTFAVKPRPGLVRVAIVVARVTDSKLARFIELARQSSFVRVFGAPSLPIGDRGVRTYALGPGRSIEIPTIRSRGAFRVVPDEDDQLLPPELRENIPDVARFRANQWCRFGE